MPKVRIEIFEGGAPSATINVPIWLVTETTGLFSGLAGGRLKESVASGEMARLIESCHRPGQLLEIQDHAANERLVISIIGDTDRAYS